MTSQKQLEEKNALQQQEETRQENIQKIAHTLKTARETASIPLDEAASKLKLQQTYLESLEKGDWSDMPEEVYTLGFLRQYATFLGADVSAEIQQIKTRHYKFTKPHTIPDAPIAPNKTWMLIAFFAFVVLFIAFNIFSDNEPAPLPSQLLKNNVEHQLSKSSHEKTSSKSSSKTSQSNKEPQLIKTPISAPTSSDIMPAEVQAINQTPAKHEKQNPPTQQHQYTLKAVSSDVWLQLHSNDAPPALLREVLLKQGESMRIESSSALLLTSGNPRALEIHLNGQLLVEAGTLGLQDKVLRNHLLQAKP